MNAILRNALAVAGVAFAMQASAQVVFYENEGFAGRTFTTEKQIGNFERFGFNDRASSVVVLRDQWEVCEDAGFSGRCIVLRAGRYPSLAAMGLNDRVSSTRIVSRNTRIEDDRHAPEPVPVYDNHRRNNERLYEANVTSVRAVVGPAEQRCWVEHEQVSQDRGSASVPAAIAGAIIGGVLGHQVGGGRGRDVATAGGAVGGAALGANVGRNGGRTAGVYPRRAALRQHDQRNPTRLLGCHLQLPRPGASHADERAPGRTVSVNRQGAPGLTPVRRMAQVGPSGPFCVPTRCWLGT